MEDGLSVVTRIEAGVLAARMSKTGKIGSVNGLEGLPNVVAQVGAYRKGAKSVRPDMEVKVIYIKDMEDAALSKEAALSLISGGADFVYGKLNAAQMGLIQAAKEKNVFTSGRSFAHVAAAPEKWWRIWIITNRRQAAVSAPKPHRPNRGPSC